MQKLKLFRNLKPVIAIDGTAVSGKGTLAKRIAEEINFDHLDTGILYRYLAYLNKIDAVNLKNYDELEKRFNLSEISRLNLRTELITEESSKIAARIETRNFLIKIQRDFSNNPPSGRGSVIDGRDIGTIVIPQAEIKFYIDADVNVRAKRRLRDLEKNIEKVNFNSVLKQITERDWRDKNRKIAPLKKHKKAVLIDTSELTQDQTVEFAIKFIKESNKINTN